MHTSILITKNYIACRGFCKYAKTPPCYPHVNGLRLIDGICVCMRVLRRKRYECLRQ